MKKRIIAIITLMFLAIPPLIGQIIYTDEDVGNHPRATGTASDFNIVVPMQNLSLDQWEQELVPLGNGLLLLAGLGTAYLLKKKKDKL